MTKFNLISFDPKVVNGQPHIRGTRLTIRRVLAVISQYPNRDELRRDYPQLTDEAIRQALAYAAANLEDRIVSIGRGR